MYERVFWWATIFERLSSTAIVLCVFAGIALLVIFLVWVTNKALAFHDADEESRRAKILFPWMMRMMTAFIITLAISVVMPSKNIVVTYAVVRAIDQYNATVPTSQLTPDKALGTVDNAVQAINDIFKAAEKLTK